MGGALLRGWLRAGAADKVFVLEPHGLPDEFCSRPDVVHLTAPSDLARSGADMLVLAVKPQVMDEVCRALAPFLTPEIPVLSIAAGRSIASFKTVLGRGRPVIRSMPNTPAAIGKGITVAVASPEVLEIPKTQAETLLAAGGPVAWVENESLLDPVTAVSGSGPAYVFLLIETLARAGEKAGLDPDLAMRLARQTVIGAAALAETDGDTPAETLRKNVTSPGGTTQAALEILMDGRMQALFDEAIKTAAERSRALSG